MKISVCMATFNGEKYIREQLASILCQISIKDEIIISDDGSTDKTISIINSFNDSRIKIYHSSKKNLIKNFENALNQVSGDIIFLSDQDDIWAKDKVAKILPLLKKNILVFSNAHIFKHNHFKTKTFLFNKDAKNLNGFFTNVYKNKYIGATIAFNINLLKVALPFPSDIPMHDMWLGLLGDLFGRTYYISEPLIFYRRHDNNASITGAKSSFSLNKKIVFRYKILKSVISRKIKYKNIK